METEYVLQMKNIEKVLRKQSSKGVDLSVKPGEIHALIGKWCRQIHAYECTFGMPVIHSTGGFLGKSILTGENGYKITFAGYGDRYRDGTPGVYAYTGVYHYREHKKLNRR